MCVCVCVCVCHTVTHPPREGWEAKALLDFFDAKVRALDSFRSRARMAQRRPPPSRRRRR